MGMICVIRSDNFVSLFVYFWSSRN